MSDRRDELGLDALLAAERAADDGPDPAVSERLYARVLATADGWTAWQQGSVSSEAGRRSPCPPVWDSALPPNISRGPKARPSLMALAMP